MSDAASLALAARLVTVATRASTLPPLAPNGRYDILCAIRALGRYEVQLINHAEDHPDDRDAARALRMAVRTATDHLRAVSQAAPPPLPSRAHSAAMSHDACETGHPTPTPAVKVTTTHTGYFLGGDHESSALTAIPYDADPFAYYDNRLSIVSLLPEEARHRDDGTALRGRFEITVRFYPSHHQGEACANGAWPPSSRWTRASAGTRYSDPTCPPGEPCQVRADEVRP